MNDLPEISATEPDWSREAFDKSRWEPAKHLLRVIRRYQRNRERGGLARLFRPLLVLQWRFWSAVCGTDIPLNTKLGGGLLMPHPNGIVIHCDAEVGPNCLLFHQVTLGMGPKPGSPVLGGHVDVGAGAKILGGVTVGDHARIGANSVVVKDVPAGASAIGIPAKIIRPPSDG